MTRYIILIDMKEDLDWEEYKSFDTALLRFAAEALRWYDGKAPRLETLGTSRRC